MGITMATPTTNTLNKDLLHINGTFVPSIQEKTKSKVCTLSLQCTLQHRLSLGYPLLTPLPGIAVLTKFCQNHPLPVGFSYNRSQ